MKNKYRSACHEHDLTLFSLWQEAEKVMALAEAYKRIRHPSAKAVLILGSSLAAREVRMWWALHGSNTDISIHSNSLERTVNISLLLTSPSISTCIRDRE